MCFRVCVCVCVCVYVYAFVWLRVFVGVRVGSHVGFQGELLSQVGDLVKSADVCVHWSELQYTTVIALLNAMLYSLV